MSALNFTVFVEKVENGTKRQTVRADRKRAIKAGERLYFFTGMRTKKCKRLRAHLEDRCLEVKRVKMWFTEGFDMVIYLDGKRLSDREIDAFVKADGFDCFGDFAAFFLRAHGSKTTFLGHAIYW